MATPFDPQLTPARSHSGAGLKWFLAILVGLIIVIGFFIAVFYLEHSDERGVTVVRMEGTMVTGDFGSTLGDTGDAGVQPQKANAAINKANALLAMVRDPTSRPAPYRHRSILY